jgi:hypothetical protein
MEVVIALALVTVIFAAVLPQLRLINNSWNSKQGGAEVLQNARVLTDHISRNLAKAVKITAVSSSSETNGYIEFEDNDGNDLRYDISPDGYVEFGPVGSLSDLAGPVSSLQFTCYSDSNFATSTTDANSIRLVNVQTTFPNPARLGQDKTFTTSVYLRTGERSDCQDGLVAWWKLDEAAGTAAADSSGNGNDGTLVNMDPATDWITGQIGSALDFDGSNDYVNCGNGSKLNITSAITIAFWINTNDSGNNDNNPYVIKSDHTYGIRHRTNNTIEFFIYDGHRYATSYGVDSSFNEQWHHIAGTYDGSTLNFYVDGQLEDSTSHTGTINTDSYDLNIARNSETTSRFYQGAIDDVRIYNRALDPNEIAQLADVLTYQQFSEAKVGSDNSSITIPTPDTNEGDLLIAAVATDGDTSSSLAPPSGQDWTQIDVSSCNSEVTLGAWWKLAGASEPADHQFTWTGSEQAYGWMMRFTGHDPNDPIDSYSSYGESSITPASPAVTTTVDNCLILRLGAFDDDDITIDDPGLSGHSPITMDESSGGIAIFQDGFEAGLANWTTDWTLSGSEVHSGSWSVHAGRYSTDLTSNVIDTSSYSSFTIDFWYKVDGIDDNDDVYLQLFDGSNFNNYFEVGIQPQGQWLHYQQLITDAKYRHANFRIRFAGSGIDQNENLWIDDFAVTVAGTGTVSGGAGYVKQSSAGDSGTSTFSLNSANEAQMLTIAIAPVESSFCSEEIRP